MIENIEEKKGYPINMIYQAPPQMPAINPYGVKASPISTAMKQSLMIVNPFVKEVNRQEPQIHKQNTINVITPHQHTPVVNINQLRPAPIMIQTDLNEIPPLVIPLSRPSPINHNIVVTTEFPYVVNQGDRDRWQYMTQYGRNPDTKEDIMHRKEMLGSYSNVDYTKRARELGNFKQSGIKFEDWVAKFYNHRNDSTKMQYGPNPVQNGNHDPPYNFGHSRGHQREHNIRGFHERLERPDMWPQERKSEDNMEHKLASRHQMPINMKINSKYDDSHFRNFLKTQQKVNDMLERILAANIRSNDGPRSVESI